MTRPLSDYKAAKDLLNTGLAQAEVARRTGIPRSTIRTWIKNGRPPKSADTAGTCDPCTHIARVIDLPEYAYLLGLYLGDGYLVPCPRAVYHLRITLDQRYPGIIAECRRAMAEVLPNVVGLTQSVGCIIVGSSSKHWPCMFPQHGAGPKHRRPIVLEPWQEHVALALYPKALLRGLIHSDGWRGTNVAVTGHGRYEYPRYQFSNRSEEIRAIFALACRNVGVDVRQSNRWNMAVSRRADVAYLDEFIGPKG